MQTAPNPDGRTARRNANREKIVSSFLEMVREGTYQPSAHQVAHQAGVSPRTVFRCFQDMESLYRELAMALQKEFLPRVLTRFDTTDRSRRLGLLIENRASVFGDMEPFRFAAETHRAAHPSLADEHRLLIQVERQRLTHAINPDGVLDADTFEALNAVTSFDFWRRLRVDQALTRAVAARTMALAATGIYTARPDPGPVTEPKTGERPNDPAAT
jgi:AcrR family transcriptional regulator